MDPFVADGLAIRQTPPDAVFAQCFQKIFPDPFPLRDVFHEIQDIVHGRDELVDLVAIERGDERLMQKLHGVVRDLIGLFFMPLDIPAPRLEAAQVVKQCLQLRRREHRVARMLIEIIEEPALPRQQTHHPCPLVEASTRDYRIAGARAPNPVRFQGRAATKTRGAMQTALCFV